MCFLLLWLYCVVCCGVCFAVELGVFWFVVLMQASRFCFLLNFESSFGLECSLLCLVIKLLVHQKKKKMTSMISGDFRNL
jgi:uncharacterized membrane protein